MVISISIDDELVQEIDKRAKKLHLTRSGYITSCMATKLSQDDIADRVLREYLRDAFKKQNLQLNLSDILT